MPATAATSHCCLLSAPSLPCDMSSQRSRRCVPWLEGVLAIVDTSFLGEVASFSGKMTKNKQ